ncbi:MAG: putative peptide modification system cyclase [Dokdonella sp.]
MTVDPGPTEGNASEKIEHSATSVLRTLVLCDLVDSTALVERLGDQKAAELFRKHDRLARALVQQHGGKEIDKTDGFLLMFDRPIQAVAFALAYQRDIAAMNGRETTKLATRFGIHVGDVVVWDNAAEDVKRGAKPTEVEGLVKPIAARLMQLALPGQILLSGTAYDIAHRAQGELGEQLANVCWRTHGRYRFKGVPDLVPVFEVGETGIAPLKPPPWSGKASRETPIWRRPLGIGFELAVLALLIAVPIFYLTRPTPAIAFANRDWVVVGDLKNLTGQKIFDDSLQTAFRIGLEQSRYVNVIPELQVRDALKRMERDPVTTKVDRGIGSEIAEREGARALILPTVAEIGGHVRITAEVIDPRTQTSVYSDSVDGTSEESVLPAMDDLLKKMRSRLGESLASIGETSAPLADVTTRNLDALKAYSLGIQAMTEAKATDAIALFSRATEIDPDFALAYLYLTNIYYSTSHYAQAHEYVQKATRNLKRLTMREQMMAQGYAAFFDNPDALRQRWSTFIKIYPDVPDAHQGLALGLWWFDNDLKGAAEQLDIVAHSRRPQRGMAWLLLGDIQVAMEQDAAAAKSYVTARQIGSPQMHLDPVSLYVARGDLEGADAALKKEDTRHFPFFEVEKSLMTTAIEVGRGHLASARVATEDAAATADRAGLETSRQRARLATLAIMFANGDNQAKTRLKIYVEQELTRFAASGETYDLSSYTHLSLAAMLALRNGAGEVAQRALNALRPKAVSSGYFSLEQPYRIAACEARIEIDARGAVACLEALLSDRSYYQTRVALLRAYTAVGDDAKALETAHWLTAHRGLATTEWLGEFAGRTMNLLAFDEATVRSAELERTAGRGSVAKELLARFHSAWKNPEGEPPLLRRSRELEGSGAENEKH